MTRRRGRYLAIFRGGKQDEIQRTIRFLTGQDKAVYPNRRVPRAETQPLYVRMFGVGLAADQRLAQRVNAVRYPGVASFFANRVFTNTTPQNQVNLPNVLNPRAVVTTQVSETGQPETSQITGRNYKDYGGTSVSVPFGGTDADESAQTAFAAIRSAVLTGAGASSRRVTYVPSTYGP